MKFLRSPGFWTSAALAATVISLISVGEGIAQRKAIELYIASPTRDAARDSLLTCGNVAFPLDRQAEAYADRRPGLHVYAVSLRMVK